MSATSHGDRTVRRPEILAGLLLAGLTAVAFAPSLANDFVNYDDPEYVTNNRWVQSGLTPEGVAWAFTTTHAANWHPLTWLSLELDHQLFGPAPWGYHLTNLLLHAANVLVLFAALRRLTGAVGRSALVAALFAVHPLHVESVAWVSERKDVLSTLFGMLTLLGYARYAERPGPGRYLLVLVPFALGLLAKPMLVTLPFVLLLLDYWPLGRMKSEIRNPKSQTISNPEIPIPKPGGVGVSGFGFRVWHLFRISDFGFRIFEKLPLFALAAVSCAVTLYAQRQAMPALAALPFGYRVVNAVTAYAGYVGKMLGPLRLAVLYPYPRGWLLRDLVPAGVLLLAVSGLALGSARRRPYLLVGWLWYLGTLVPVIGLVQVGKQQMADRYTYFPLIGLFLILVWAVADLAARRPSLRALPAALAALVLAVCVVLTWRQAATWRDSASLWNQALRATTDNSDAHLQVGSLLEARGQPGQAVEHFRRAVSLAPDDPLARLGLGVALSRLGGQADEAAVHLTEALRLDPRLGKAHHALGAALELLGKPGEARQEYEAALRLGPGDAALHNDLGAVCYKFGDYEEARRQFAAAVGLDPRLSEPHNNLGIVLLERGKVAAAEEEFAAALGADPDNALAHCNRGRALARLGRSDEAADEYRAALRLSPDLERARRGLEEIEAAGEPR
jgi:Flp pilus assembly protein TadD